MDEILTYKKRIIRNLILLLILTLVSVLVVIAAASELKAQSYAILILVILLIEFPIIFNLGFSGIRALNLIIENEEKKLNSNEEIEKLEQEVEEKAKEADELSFNFNLLKDNLTDVEDINDFGTKLLSGIGKQLDIVLGVFYKFNQEDQVFEPLADYAYYSDSPPEKFKTGEGLNGQVVQDKKSMHIEELPEGYTKTISGLGKAQPKHLLILPLIDQNNVSGLLEIATFKNIDKGILKKTDEIATFVGSLMAKIG